MCCQTPNDFRSKFVMRGSVNACRAGLERYRRALPVPEIDCSRKHMSDILQWGLQRQDRLPFTQGCAIHLSSRYWSKIGRDHLATISFAIRRLAASSSGTLDRNMMTWPAFAIQTECMPRAPDGLTSRSNDACHAADVPYADSFACRICIPSHRSRIKSVCAGKVYSSVWRP